MPPDFDAITTGRRRDAVERDAQVELAVDVEGLLDEDLLDDATGGPRLRRDQRHAEDALGEVVRLLGILRELHAAALAAAPGVDLRLDDRAPAEPPRDLPRLGRAVGDLAARHGDAEVREDRLGLVLVDFHGERARIIWESGPTGGRRPGRRGPSPKARRRPPADAAAASRRARGVDGEAPRLGESPEARREVKRRGENAGDVGRVEPRAREDRLHEPEEIEALVVADLDEARRPEVQRARRRRAGRRSSAGRSRGPARPAEGRSAAGASLATRKSP